MTSHEPQIKHGAHQKETTFCSTDLLLKEQTLEADRVPMPNDLDNNHSHKASDELAEFAEATNGSNFLRRFFYLF